jgi:hypothetical protein
MKRVRRTQLLVEALEDRFCPSLTLTLASGTLFISGSPTGSPLLLNETAANSFKVMDGTMNLGTYSGVSNINMNLSSHTNKAITFDFGGNRLGGNLFINEGLGVHAAPGTTGTGLLNGSIGGSVTVVGGSGDEELRLGTNGQGSADAALAVGGNVTFSPHTNAIVGGKLNTFDTEGGTGPTVTVGGSVSLNNVGNVALGTGTTVGQDVSISAGSGQPENVIDVATINRNLSISSIGTTANINLGFMGLPATIKGSLSANLNTSGNDTFSFTATSTIGGNANISTGAGNDSIVLNGPISGSASVNGGEGNDTITSATTGTVAGNLSLTEGNGNSSVSLDGSVTGNESFTLGSGNDTVTIGNAPNGLLSWNSGNGADSVTFGDSSNAAGETWNVNMRFGTGNDTLTLAGNGTVGSPEALTGFIDMGGPPGGNQFDPTGSTAAGTWVIVSPFTLQNV